MPDIYLIYAYIERERAVFNCHPGWFAACYQARVEEAEEEESVIGGPAPAKLLP